MKKIVYQFVFLVLSLNLSAQNVGIGTNTPSMALHIRKPNDTALLQLDNGATLDVNSNVGMYFRNGAYHTGAIKTIGTSTNAARLGFFTFANGISQNNLRERLSITDNGNVGIGNSNPQSVLHLLGSANEMLRLESNIALGTNVSTDMYFKTGTYFTGAIRTIGTNANSARLGFFTSANANKTGLFERLTILDDGNVGIGTSNPQAALDVIGSFRFTNGTQGLNKVLTSDAAGFATWGSPLPLPYSNSVNHNGPAFSVTNTNNTLNGIAIVGNGVGSGVVGTTNGFFEAAVKGYPTATATIGVLGYTFEPSFTPTGYWNTGVVGMAKAQRGVAGVTETGVGVEGFATATNGVAGSFIGSNGGKALKTEGAIQLTNLSEGAGKVLTSDANGNATWRTPALTNSALRATNPALQAIASGNFYQRIDFSTACATCFNDLGLSSSVGTFTIAATGVYEVDVNIGWILGTTFSSAAMFEVGVGELSGGWTEFLRNRSIFEYSSAHPEQTQNLHGILKLTAGTILSVSVRQFSGAQQHVSSVNSATNWSIRRLY
jgi:hypothetical protein